MNPSLPRTGGGVMGSLVPAPAVVVEATSELWNERQLLPEELARLANAVPKRRQEHAAGRACARRALASLGYEPAPILSGPDRAPLWPAGIVGSITHCSGFCAAAVARSTDLATLGIDAERNRALPEGVEDLTCTPSERRWSRAMGNHLGINWSVMIFSAKESAYKAWYPIAGTWLGYLDAEVNLLPDQGCFRIRILVAAPEPRLQVFDGRFAATEDHVLTAVTVPH